MADTSIHIEGLEELTRKLEALGRMDALKNAIKAATAHVKGKIDKYPPSTEANSPAQRRWYERGYGSRWRRKDGSIGGRKTSETLGRKWTTRTTNNGLTGIVGNNVSYSPFVHDPDDQTTFHKLHGWKTTEQVATEEAKTVSDFIVREIRKAINA